VFGWIFAAHQFGAGLMAFLAGVFARRAHELPAGLPRGRRAMHRRGAVAVVAEKPPRACRPGTGRFESGAAQRRPIRFAASRNSFSPSGAHCIAAMKSAKQ